MAASEDKPLSDREAAELAALADGSLPPERRAALEQRAAESPRLRAALDDQLRALRAVRSLDDPAPAPLRAAVQAERERRPRRRLLPAPVAVGLGVGATTVGLAAALAWPGSGPNRPTVVAVAGLALRAPSAPVPQHPAKGATTLPTVALEGVSYPNWYGRYGWEAVGLRSDRLQGRRVVTVFYGKHGQRIGYTVVSGAHLTVPRGAATTVSKGITLHSFPLAGRTVVTWERKGHTCVLAGAAQTGTLIELAAWKAKGAIEF